MVAMKSPHQNTARNCPRRRNCHICLEKHPTGLHEYMIRRNDGSKSDDDPGKTIKNNCANIKDFQFESIRTGEDFRQRDNDVCNVIPAVKVLL